MAETGPRIEDIGTHVVVEIPMQMKRRGGRRQVIVPEGLPQAEERSSGYHESLVLAIARAHQWRELIESGKYSTLTEIARDLKVDPSYAARIYRLTLLAPDIIETVLAGKEPEGFTMRRLAGKIPILWDEQRRLFGFS